MKIAICDNDKQDLLQIRRFMDELFSSDLAQGKLEIHNFESSVQLINQLKNGKYFDVFLLDIIMPGVNGMELAADIRNTDQVSKIIFLTSSPEFALESYSVGAFNYLLKPLKKDKLFSVLKKAINEVNSGMKKHIIINTKSGMLKIFMHELLYVEVIGRTTFFHQTNGEVIEGICKISQIEAVLLIDKRFIKPHRSYIVNLDYIKNLSQDGFMTKSNHLIPISRNVFKEVKQAYINYSFQEEE